MVHIHTKIHESLMIFDKASEMQTFLPFLCNAVVSLIVCGNDIGC
jgi:hypothetical protein